MRRGLIFAGALVLIAALPMVSGNYLLRLGTILAMYVVLAQSWNFIGGLAGYPSFATAAFFGVGAYVSAVLQSRGVPVVLAWSVAAFAAIALAALIGAAILHLRGHYFAIASLVVVEVLREIVNTTPELTGGGMGLNLPIPRASVEAQARVFYCAMWGLSTLCMVTALVVHRSKLGFGLRCIQQNEDAASVLGINTYGYKTAAFALSAMFVGVAGAIYASWVHYIEPPDVFDVLLSVKPLVMVLFGGLGTLFGPVIGAVILLTLEELVWRNFLTVHAGVLGVLITVLVLFMPEGILPRLGRRLAFGRPAQ
jgi:branched-chain amino acid transport system permease protein